MGDRGESGIGVPSRLTQIARAGSPPPPSAPGLHVAGQVGRPQGREVILGGVLSAAVHQETESTAVIRTERIKCNKLLTGYKVTTSN